MTANPNPSAEDDGDERRVGGEEALERLRSVDPPLYLSPSPELSRLARAASHHLFSSLLPFCPKTPFDRLFVEEGFDAEQIWGQIDSLSRPLVSVLRRELKRIERDPPSLISDGLPAGDAAASFGGAVEAENGGDMKEAAHDEEEDGEEEEAADDDEEEEEEEEDADDDEEEDEKEEEEAAGDEKGSGIEDRFLKIKELEEYLETDEAKEYGHPERRGRSKDEDEDEEAEEEEDNLELGSFDGDDSEENDSGESARYEDFFGSKKRGVGKGGGGKKERSTSKKVKFLDGLEDLEIDDGQKDDRDDDEQKDDRDVDAQDKALSTHEKQRQKIHSKIEQMEKSNLEEKSWIMQGEVTAAKRPINSALEVDLDFEHNMRPAPVITEEVTASLEDLVKKRIIEGHFDDVQRAPALPSKAPKELKELDENKSKKGLAEIYEDEYAQKAGLASVPISSSDEQKKEASILFKKLCLKLDAVSHFHFAPKPIIEDMSIQANVPAFAMEEIAPVAVSDAAMLAPEEIFEGKGDIKEETELTQAERKRRRASKKRRFKAESAKREAKKARASGAPPVDPNA